MTFPVLSESARLERLQPPRGPVRMVLDTDTYNEIDDQFAVVQCLLSPEKLKVESVYAAPFENDRSTGPGDGMEKSHEELLQRFKRLDKDPQGLVHKGSAHWLKESDGPVDSPAARDLVEKAMAGSETLYVVAIGAITNVASALLLEPRLVEKIVVIWLGGNALYWPHTWEFNLQQDIAASRLIFDCGVPLVQLPCQNVVSHLHTTLPEMREWVKGRGAIGDFLYQRYEEYAKDHFAHSKEIWDIAAAAWLLDSDWVETSLVHSPILTDQMTFSRDPSRHFIRSAVRVDRDKILGDLFRKLERAAS